MTQETLFKISQTGILGKVTENTGYKKEIIITKNTNFDINLREFIQGQYRNTLLVSHNLTNKSNSIFGIIYNILDNSIRNIELNLTTQSTLSNFQRIVQSLLNNELLLLFFEKKVQDAYQIDQLFYNYCQNLGQNQIIPPQSEMNQNFCYQQIISGANKKIICEQQNYISNELNLNYQFNNETDIGSIGYGNNLLPSDKIQFQTNLGNVLLFETNIIQDNYLIFTGQIKKNTNILQNFPDAKIKIDYLDSQNQILSSDFQQKQSSFQFQDLTLISKVNKNSTKIKVYIICENYITIPGSLELKNLQLFWAPVKYEPKQDPKFLTRIQKAGIETNSYIEQIGFNPRSVEDYKSEYNQNLNLFRNKDLPVIVEEPIKFFDQIIDNNNHRVVIKQTSNEKQISLPKLDLDFTKSYLIGAWIQSKIENQNIKFFVTVSQDSKQLKGNNYPKNQEILLDEQNISHNDFKFYYGFIYPQSLKNNSDQDNLNLLNKLDNQLSEIQTDHLDQNRGVILLENKDCQISSRIQITGQSISQTIVMPICKELQITQIHRDRITSIDLEEINN